MFVQMFGLKKQFAVDIANSSGLLASLNLSFNLVGPGSTECEHCHLFLGDLPFFAYENAKYHARCVVCQFCATSLCPQGTTISFKIRKLEHHEGEVNPPFDFTCFKCFSKKFEDNTPCVIVASDSVTNSRFCQNSSPHSFEKCEFLGGVNWCGFCGDTFKARINLNLKSEGYICSACKYPCHIECMESVPQDCTKDANKSILHSGSPSSKVSTNVKATLRKSIGRPRKGIGSTSNVF